MSKDPRTTYMKQEMARHFREFEQDYRDMDALNIVKETDDYVLIEDTRGHEFSEWAETFEDTVLFHKAMHSLADDIVERRWPSTYPLVFDKFEDS